MKLAEPPNLLVENNTDKVDYPEERRSANNKNSAKNDTENVFSLYAFDYTIKSPENRNTGKAKNNFYDPRKIVDCFDQIFHFRFLQKIFFEIYLSICNIIHYNLLKRNIFLGFL